MEKSEFAQLVRLLFVSVGSSVASEYDYLISVALIALFVLTQFLRVYCIKENLKNVYKLNPNIKSVEANRQAIDRIPIWVKLLPI